MEQYLKGIDINCNVHSLHAHLQGEFFAAETFVNAACIDYANNQFLATHCQVAATCFACLGKFTTYAYNSSMSARTIEAI